MSSNTNESINRKNHIKRTLSLFLSHGYGQAVTLLTNIALPAILIRQWGADDYAVWLTATAVSQFFLFTDLGLNNAAANYLCIHDWKGQDQDREAFTATLIGKLKQRTIIACVLTLPISIAYALLNQGSLFKTDLTILIILLGIATATNTAASVNTTILRADGELPRGVLVQNTIRLIDFIATAACCYFTASTITAAILCVIKALQFLYFTKRFDSRFNPQSQDASKVDPIRASAFGFTKIQVAQIASLQGITLAIGVKYGSTALLAFATIRTITRLPIQPIIVLTQTITPLLTEFYSKRNTKEYKRLIAKTIFLCGISYAIYALASTLFSKEIILLWLGHQLNFDQYLFAIIAATSLISGLTYITSACLAATNKTRTQGIIMTSAALLSITLTVIPNQYMSLNSYALALLIVELASLLLITASYRKN